MDSADLVKYKVSSKLVASEVANETVILDYEAGKYFALDGVGSFVWAQFQKDEPLSIAELSQQIIEVYDVEEAQCMADLKALIADLRKNGLIETSS